MASLAKALPLAALLFSVITHASPHALGVTASHQHVQVREESSSDAVPAASVSRLEPASEKLYILAFEEGKKFDASFLDEVSAVTGGSATLVTDLTGGRIFNGVSIQVLGANDTTGLAVESSILSLPGVTHAALDQPITRAPINVTSSLIYDERLTNSSSSRSTARQSGELYTNDKIMMQVDRLRAQGITGKGIKVAIMDNAIDTLHPAITVDYVVDYRQQEDIDDPTPSCKSHATACGGLVKSGAGPLGYNTGVAPGALLGNYVLGGCIHGGHSGLVIQSLEQAAIDGTNIMSASLSYGDNNWKFFESTGVFTRVAEAGVLLVFAAGNGGNEGLWRNFETCSAPGVLCVGMLTNTVVTTWENHSPVTINGVENSWTLGWLQSSINGGWPTLTLPVWANMMQGAGGWDGHGGDGCHELPEDVPDLSQYIVLIRRKLCNEDDMIDRVSAAGAKYILIAELSDSFPDVFNPDIRRAHPNVTALATISGVHGVDIVKALGKNQTVELNLSNRELAIKERPRKENGEQIPLRMDSGSQWGPTFDAGATTDISAPGTDIPILAPVGSKGGIYGIATGTSLATPLVAGAAALLMEALGTTDPKIIANVLISTSKPLNRTTGGGWGPGLASTAHQGGGLIRTVNAAAVTAVVSQDVLEFNDTLHRQERSFAITNRGSRAITYQLTNLPAASIYSFATDGVPFPPGGDNTIRNNLYVEGAATLTFVTGTSVTVPANGAATVRVTAADPAGLNTTRLPVWSGYVRMTGSDGTELTVPYLGMGGDVDRVPKTYKAFVQNPGATLPTDELILQIHHGMGTKATEIYLVNATTGELAHPNQMFYTMSTHVVAYTIGWRGKMNDGTLIPAGEYRLRVKSLRAFARKGSTNNNDYVYFDGEPFTFKR